MKISVEISYYPLREEYIPHILQFIDNLKKQANITVKKSDMSTLVFGEYKMVMDALHTEIEKAFEIPNAVFVLKIINSDLQHYSNTHE